MKVYFMKLPMGWSVACFSLKGLTFLSLPYSRIDTALAEAWQNFNEPMECGEKFISRQHVAGNKEPAARLFISLLDYFEKGINNFDIAIDWSEISGFAREVYQVVASIPYGEVRTYSWVAEQIGKAGAARAVGQALKRNPFPLIIPCHRVVSVNGLGGFGGGVKMKKKLLTLEGYNISRLETG